MKSLASGCCHLWRRYFQRKRDIAEQYAGKYMVSRFEYTMDGDLQG